MTPEASLAETKATLLKLVATCRDLSAEVGQKLQEFEDRLFALEVLMDTFFTWPGKEDTEEDEDAPKDH